MEELYYDRSIKKWRSFDSQTGEVGGIVRDREKYFIVNIENYRLLGGIVGMQTLGFFSMFIGFLEYRNRVSVSYTKLMQEYGISSATIKKHLDVLKRNNVIMEQVSGKGKRHYLVNGEYVFRGSVYQMEENRRVFKDREDEMRKELSEDK